MKTFCGWSKICSNSHFPSEEIGRVDEVLTCGYGAAERREGREEERWEGSGGERKEEGERRCKDKLRREDIHTYLRVAPMKSVSLAILKEERSSFP